MSTDKFGDVFHHSDRIILRPEIVPRDSGLCTLLDVFQLMRAQIRTVLLWTTAPFLAPLAAFSQGAGCTFAISPTAVHLPAAGGSGTVAITPSSSSSECAPVPQGPPTDPDGWVLWSIYTSMVNNVYYFGALPNPGPARTETLWVLSANLDPNSFAPFTVTQDGWDGSLTAGCGAYGIFRVNVEAPISCGSVGGTSPYFWSVSAGYLPPGFAFNFFDGLESSFPASAGPFNFTLKVTDSSPTPQVSTFTQKGAILPSFPIIYCSSNGSPSGDTPFAVSCLGYGGTPPYRWSISGGSLPAGLSLAAAIGNGITISGTPSDLGEYSYTLLLTDSTAPASYSATLMLSGDVVPAAKIPGTLSLNCTPWNPDITLGQALPPVLCSASGGTPPYTWSASSVPTGVSLAVASANTAAITGTPTYSAEDNIQLNVTDSSTPPQTSTQSLPARVDVNFGITCTSVQDQGADVPTYLSCSAIAGVYPLHWSVGRGELPAGLQQGIDVYGKFFLYGTPAPGPYNFTITAADSSLPTPLTSSQTFSGALASSESAFGPQISLGGIVGLGGSVPPVTQLAPLGVVSLYGTGFAPAGTAGNAGPSDLFSGRLPTNFAGICVTVNIVQDAPILSVYPDQINFQVPDNVSGSSLVQVTVNCGGETPFVTNPQRVSIQAAAPEFLYFVANANGIDPIAATDLRTGAYVGPPSLPVEAAPAKPGDIVTLFGIGFGPTALAPNGPQAGLAPTESAAITLPLQMSLGGAPVPATDILYAGVTPGFVGLYQINVRIPTGTPDGDLPVIATIGGIQSPSGGYLTVHQ